MPPQGVIPPDSYLGPASGRITVYEQQARLHFELERAQARLAQLRGSAQAAGQTARVAELEVGRLQGLLLDLESRHKLQVGGQSAPALPAHCRKPSSLHSTSASRPGRDGSDPAGSATRCLVLMKAGCW